MTDVHWSLAEIGLYSTTEPKGITGLSMVLQIVLRKVFSQPMRGLERFAENNNIPWNLPTIFHPELIASIPQKFLPFLILRTALPAMPFVSDR